MIVFQTSIFPLNAHYVIENAFETFRKDLGGCMNRADNIIRSMENIESLESKFSSNRILKDVHNNFRELFSQVPHLWEENEVVLRKLVSSDVHFISAISNRNWDSNESNGNNDGGNDDWSWLLPSRSQTNIHASNNSKSNSKRTRDEENMPQLFGYDSLVQVSVHLARDWGEAGNDIRNSLYSSTHSIIDLLTQSLPVNAANEANEATDVNLRAGGRARVLVPGSGAGRLAVELAARGFSVEANDCSLPMIAALTGVLEQVLAGRSSFTIYPHLNSILSDKWDFGEMLRPEVISYDGLSPEIKKWLEEIKSDNDEEFYKNSLSLIRNSLTAEFGDFLLIYNRPEHKNRFDSVVTCFFLDTSDNILQYMVTIYSILKEGGIWINAGPLHYHNPRAIPYSHKMMLVLAEGVGFTHTNHSEISTLYATERGISMKPELYNIPADVFAKKRMRKESGFENKREELEQEKWISPNFII